MTFTINARDESIPYATKDGSTIREILIAENRSLAEAIVSSDQATAPHYHIKSEEIYYILSGQGTLFLEDEESHVTRGDAVLILAGKQHSIYNSGAEELILLCCCAPGYKHEDTILI